MFEQRWQRSCRWLLAMVASIGTGVSWPGPTHADVIVSDPSVRLFDPEFDQAGERFTWVAQDGRVFIGYVDRATGNFVPPNGAAVLVAEGALTVPNEVGNGPEWVFTSSEPQIVYTAANAAGGRTVARARKQGEVWISEVLPFGNNRFAPIGSLDRGDPSPRISYLQRTTEQATTDILTKWRNLDDAGSEQQVPGADVQGLRWVEGRRAMVYSAVVQGVRQAFLYDIDTQKLEQLTFDAGPKESVFMWQAPEFDNEYIFFALINESSLGIYRQVNGAWSKIYALKPPSKGRFIQSPEFFKHNGKSYLFMVTSDSPLSTNKDLPSDIWLAGIDPNAPDFRQCSDASEKVRKDPEVFITDLGPFLYYAAKPEGGAFPVIYRCDTGLGPRQ
ncbi:hypothetical protein [Gloeobacter morelensis]|uniref:hypothetical protein n=1 Tax=Gloeobacter morelensis TaxID=2907343 RepID=UPI001E49E3E7|nr:hypothetical protein [Gloeobacter morelensis]